MSYKDSSRFGSNLPTDCSEHTSRSKPLVKSNADIFAERGQPWNAPDIIKVPRLSPDGELRMSRRAHVYTLTAPAPAAKEDNPDLSFSTEHCQPISVRLARERNTLIKSMSSRRSDADMNSGSQTASPRNPLLSVRARLTQRRSSHLVKVK